VKIGTNESFHHVLFQWSDGSVVLTRQNDYVTEIKNVVRVEEEFCRLEESQQDVLLLRFHDQQGGVRTLFIDSDPVQTNVREVAGHLERLDQVFAWLLPLDYVHRQGDVGLYSRETLPADVERVPSDLYPDRFIEVLSRRHGFDPENACEFYAVDDRFYVRVVGVASMIHPEHEAIPLSPGLYELVGARGTPLPEFVGLRPGETRSLGE
jgi:hypothetical protein